MTKKEALLKAAKELFGEYGYAETTFKRISEKADVALGLLTHHYGSKEKLFLAAGIDVLDKFINELKLSVEDCSSGKEAVLSYCKAYLAFTINPKSDWLVLVRCSPYSDMKGIDGKAIMYDKYQEVHKILEQSLSRGMMDGTIRKLPIQTTQQVIVSMLVGVNRTNVLTPYASKNLYEETIYFVDRAITS